MTSPHDQQATSGSGPFSPPAYSPGQAPQYGPPPGYPIPPIPPKKKSKAPLILGILAGVFFLVVGGCTALVMAASSELDQTVKEFESSVATAAPEAPSMDAPEQAPAAQQAVSGIGTPVRDGKFEFTVTAVEPGPARIGNEYLGKEPQGQFVLVRVTVANIGDVAQIFHDSSQKLFDASGREFSADSEAAIYLDNAESFLNEINPGNRIEGTIVFDLPADAQPSRIELHDSPFSGGVSVTLG